MPRRLSITSWWPSPVARPALLVALLLTAACGRSPEADARPAEPIVTLGPDDVVTARIVALENAITLSGSLEPARTVAVKAQVEGRVRSLAVDRGTPVRRGQLLATIEADGVRGQALSARAAVASAEAALALSRQRLEAARRLLAAGGISDIEARTAEANHEAALAQVAAARAQAAAASASAANTTIRSPIDGIVSERAVEEGEAVRVADAIVSVVDTRTLELSGQVGVDDAGRVRVGQVVRFTVSGDDELRGRVARVDPRADPATRQVGVYAELPNASRRIVAGQFAHGRILVGDPVEVIAIPASAIRESVENPHVLVVEQETLVRRDVVVRGRDDARGLVGITSGLRVGDRVLAVAVAGIGAGARVTLAPDADRAGVTAAPPGTRAPGKDPAIADSTRARGGR